MAGLFVSLAGVVDMPEDAILPYFSDELVAVIQSDHSGRSGGRTPR